MNPILRTGILLCKQKHKGVILVLTQYESFDMLK